jgi:hypothetical protein
MKTRIGKIARLPKAIREQLNQRIEDGVPCKDLVGWLNGLPETQRVLAEQFGGRPVNKQNMSDWLHGGYEDWVHSRDSRMQMREMVNEAHALSEKGKGADGSAPSHYLGSFVLVELAKAIDEVHDMKNSEKRWKLLRKVSMELSRLRSDDTREKLLRLRGMMAEATRANKGQSRCVGA